MRLQPCLGLMLFIGIKRTFIGTLAPGCKVKLALRHLLEAANAVAISNANEIQHVYGGLQESRDSIESV